MILVSVCNFDKYIICDCLHLSCLSYSLVFISGQDGSSALERALRSFAEARRTLLSTPF